MAWKMFQKTDTGSSTSSSVSSTTKSLNRLSLEKPIADNKVLIKLHFKEKTYRIRYDLSEGYLNLRKLVMEKLDFPANEGTLGFGYVNVDYYLVYITKTEDLVTCKEYTDLHYKTNYIRIVVYDSKDGESAIVRDYKNMETLRKGDLAVVERTKLPLQPAASFSQNDSKKPQKTFELVTVIDGKLVTNTIDYAFKDGFDGLWKIVSKKFKDTDSYFLAYFDRYSMLTLIRDSVDFNESYSWMGDKRNPILYYFPKEQARMAYKHHYQEMNKRRKEQKKTDEKSDSAAPPEYHSLSDVYMDAYNEQGVRYFKIEWASDTVPYYGFFKYNPSNGVLVFKDIVEKQFRRKVEQSLGYFDEDMDSITIETDEDLLECVRAVRGPITIFGVVAWSGIRKEYRLWYEERLKLQQEERNAWDN